MSGTVALPDSLTQLGASAFSGCKEVEAIQIGSGLTDIPPNAFAGCTNLKTITVNNRREDVTIPKIDGVTVTYTIPSLEATDDKVSNAEGALSLQQAVDQANGPVTIEIEKNICLNAPVTIAKGKQVEITANANENYNLFGNKDEKPTNLFVVEEGGELSLTGALTLGGWNNTGSILVNHGKTTIDGNVVIEKSTLEGDSMGVIEDNGSSAELILENGTIQNHKIRGALSASIRVTEGASFTMNGGTIQANIANTSSSDSSSPAVLLLGASTFTMNGGSICNNSGQCGTAVYLTASSNAAKARFTMNGGTICDNIAKYNGGGVRQPGGSVTNHNIIFTMNGGSITRNSSTKQGGGIYHETRERSYVELKGGSITNNTANEGGGVYYNNSSGLSSVELKMSGAVTIKDNTEKGIPSNVYLSGYAPIKISGALTGEKIGVRRDPASTLTIAQGSDYVISKSDLNVLQSDSEEHTLVLNQWGGVSLEERGTLAASDFVFEAPEDLVWDDTAKAAKVTARNGLTCGAITVKYYDSNGAELASAPKETGTYSVKIDVAASRDYKAASGISDSSWTYTIVPDTTAPQISGITQDKIYCGAVTAIVTDKNLREVTVDGNKVTLQDNRFTVSPKKGVQKIEASDKSGNKTTVSITVNNGHTKNN